jgi:hypothetical protein
MLSPHAPSAEINLFRFSIDNNSSALDIRKPAPSGMLFRVTYPVAEVYSFATDIAFISQIANSFYLNWS